VKRGQLIRTGIAGMAVLAVAGCARSKSMPPFEDARYRYRQLTAGDRALVAAVSAAMLAGALPADPAGRDVALLQAVRGVDVAVAGLAPDVRAEVHQLFGLLQFPVTRTLAAGVWSSWNDAETPDVAAFLQRWRFSSVSLFRTGYQALHKLVMASWYGSAASWPRIGYPGPPAVG
jgi:hypothetical protein